jgi:hypothetical protein
MDQTRGIDYTQDNVDKYVRQVCNFLHRQHMECHQVVVDFDLLAVFLVQEADPKMHIRHIVDLFLQQFQTSTSDTAQPPQTTLQSQLLHAAEAVRVVIQSYDQDPTTRKPFCLWYPTFLDVLDYSISKQHHCELLPTDKMVVLLDEAGICVGVGVPPMLKTSEYHLRPEVCFFID